MSDTVYTWAPTAAFLVEGQSTQFDQELAVALPAGYWIERTIVHYELRFNAVATALSPLPKWKPLRLATYLRQGIDHEVPLDLSSDLNDLTGDTLVNWGQDTGMTTSEGFLFTYYAPRSGLPFDAKGRRTVKPENDANNTYWLSLGTGTPDTPSDQWSVITYDLAIMAQLLIGHHV